MPVSYDKLVDAWMKQSELLWRTVYATPAVATAVFAGWYVASKNSETGVSRAVLLVGIIMMIVQWMIIHRMARYLNKFRDAVGEGLPHVEKTATATVFGKSYSLPTGHQLATSVPVIVGFLFSVMLLLSFV